VSAGDLSLPVRGERGLEPADRALRRARPTRGECGQASLELLGLLPLLVAIALAAAQLLAVGYSSVLAGNAAEAGALALAGGGNPRAGSRAALPGWSRAHARVSVSGGRVRVELRPPVLLRALAERLEVSASARVEAP
jgi:pilus assembly protein CpaE